MSKEPSRLKNTKKGLHKTRRSVSSVHVPVTSAVDGSSSRMVIGTTSSSDPAPSTAASSVTAANHGTDAGSPVDKPLATEAGVVPSVPVPAGERSKRPEFSDAMPAGSPADVVPLSNAPDVVAVPVAAQVSLSKARTRRSRRIQSVAKQHNRRTTEAVSNVDVPLRELPATSITGTEANARRKENPEAVGDKIQAESDATTRERPQEQVFNEEAPLKATLAEGAAAEPRCRR
ncbi:hypothetical protein V5799_023705 [Amblyomma americanum]|uniref:Uncharacterized protein n=1 Tax=Amblyomma americanum TaxID=6943 RepID=A0AAQ4FHS3_AMBAM